MALFRNRRTEAAPQGARVKVWHKPAGSYYRIASAPLDAEHALIAGSTGCGKSTYLRAILQAFYLRFAPSEAEAIIIDPKVTELWRYEATPHCKAYITDKAQACQALENIYNEIIARQQAARRNGADDYEGKALYIFIDELNPLMNCTKYGRRIAKALEDIATLGRSAKVHLIACTQNPNRKTLPGNIADNCTCRIGLKCQTRYQSTAIVNQSGCEELPRHGEAIADINGDFGKFKIPFVQKSDVLPLIEFWAAQA